MKEASAALLIIDMINKMDFEGGEDLLDYTLPMTDHLIELKKRVKEKGLPVIYVNDNFGQWQDNASEIIKECLRSPGRPIVEKIEPENDDFFIIKPKHSAFFGTQLEILLNQMGVEKLILTGVAGDMCVLFTANDAYMREYDLWVPEDCIASESKEANEHALQIIRRSVFADTTPSKEFDLSEFMK
ncbi:isochorismatase family cysteine hydrolase [Falsibacillus pallidus]|uniref:isochorismatase family cysteine hydrolase n=1 Tax=Falsibacillus pallidus TaxID=493781 RepID=UPI003D978D60